VSTVRTSIEHARATDNPRAAKSPHKIVAARKISTTLYAVIIFYPAACDFQWTVSPPADDKCHF